MMLSPFMKRANQQSIDKGHHGKVAEVKLTKRINATPQPYSGAVDGAKGDALLETANYSFLIESKTTKGDSFSVRRDWCYKIHHEALAVSKIPALTVTFTNSLGDSERRGRWVMIPEHVFIELVGGDYAKDN